jgi:hypothetical protein
MSIRPETFLTLIFAVSLLLGCKAFENLGANGESNANSNSKTVTARANTDDDEETVEQNEDGTIPSGSGVEKEKPEAGKGNVQGKAMFNDAPAAGVEVKLCETFSRFVGGCSGQIFKTKTDEAGEYLIKNVPPGVYEGLTVQVFNTPYYVFATSGIVAAAKYKVEADETYFAPDTHLFKNDIKVANPKAGGKLAPENIEVSWAAYPDAAYYKFSIFADTSTGAEPPYDFINKRVEDVSFVLDKPLKPGGYSLKLEAFNSNDRKLAQNSNDLKFSVK